MARLWNSSLALPGCVVLAGSFFLVDVLTPWSAGVATSYIVVILASAGLASARHTWVAASVCTVLVLVGFVRASASSPLPTELALPSRGLAVFALWVTAALVNQIRRDRTVLYGALDKLPHAALLVDEDGIVRFASEASRSVFRHEPAALVGRSVDSLVPAGTSEAHAGLRARFHDEPRARPMGAGSELQAVRADGTLAPVEITLNPLRVGRREYVLCSVCDTTRRTSAESFVARQNRDVESLLYVLSHDLKEPLRAIESFSRLVQERAAAKLDEKEQDFLARVVRATERMRGLIDDILALSRARRAKLATEATDAYDLVHHALSRVADVVESTQARVTVSGDLPRLNVEPTWGEEAVYHLFSNALKFATPGAPPEIEVAATGRAGLVVRDRGPGVAAEHSERIFGLFQRAHGRDVEGSGAGLAIVRAIAERHGGRAWVEARPGGGAEFFVTFAATDETREKVS